jgi:HEAT repeat protein
MEVSHRVAEQFICIRPVPASHSDRFRRPWPSDLDLDKSMPFWIKSLRSKNEQMRISAGVKLRDLGPKAEPAMPALIEALGDPNVTVEGLARDALEEIGDPALPALLNAAKSPKVKVRSRAVWMLGGFKADRKAILSVLLKAMEDPEVEVRRGASTAIGGMKEYAETVVPVLIKALGNQNEDEQVRIHAAHSLGRFEANAKCAIPYLLQALKDKSRSVSDFAGFALGKIGAVDPIVVPALIECLKSDWTAQAAAGALGDIGPKASEAVPPLIELARLERKNKKGGSQERVREVAVRALGRMGTAARPAVLVLLEILKNRELPSDMRRDAAISLSQISPKSPETMTALREAAKEKDASLSQVARQMLEKIGAK